MLENHYIGKPVKQKTRKKENIVRRNISGGENQLRGNPVKRRKKQQGDNKYRIKQVKTSIGEYQ